MAQVIRQTPEEKELQQYNISRKFLDGQLHNKIKSCESSIRTYEKYLIEHKAKRDAYRALQEMVVPRAQRSSLAFRLLPKSRTGSTQRAV